MTAIHPLGVFLTCNGRRVAPLEITSTPRGRLKGLLGRNAIDGALLLRPAAWVHSLGMRFDLDVAYLDRDLAVLEVTTLRRNRVSRPRSRARAVLEAQAGAFARWGLRAGDRLGIEEDDPRREC
jgi:uncharacterized protein